MYKTPNWDRNQPQTEGCKPFTINHEFIKLIAINRTFCAPFERGFNTASVLWGATVRTQEQNWGEEEDKIFMLNYHINFFLLSFRNIIFLCRCHPSCPCSIYENILAFFFIYISMTFVTFTFLFRIYCYATKKNAIYYSRLLEEYLNMPLLPVCKEHITYYYNNFNSKITFYCFVLMFR